MLESFRTTIAGILVMLVGLALVLTGKSIETGIGLLMAGAGLALARDQATSKAAHEAEQPKP